MTHTAGEIASLLQGEMRGDAATVVADAQPVEKAGPTDIVFVTDDHHLRKLRKSQAGVALVPRKLAESLEKLEGRTLILVDDAHSAFLRIVEMLRPRPARRAFGVSPQAIVSPSAQIAAGTNIHPGAIVGENVVIGRDCDIHSGVVLGPNCRIGDNVVLFPNVVLYAEVTIGQRVIVHAGAVIGSDGFGYRLVNGRHQKIPHYGAVRVEDDVEIGACTTIDRAMVGTTVIGAGTKIDNLVQIAHNCELGRHNILCSQVGFAGTSTTGDYVVCAGQVGVADHVHLADRCTMGAKAAAHRDMGSEAYHGVPALPAAESVRLWMHYRKLPDLKDQVNELQKRLDVLTKRLEDDKAAA